MSNHNAEFAHLHTHSTYSFLDGAARVSDLAERASDLGMKFLALTDHGYMHGAAAFWEACEKEGIQPLIGLEAYMVDSVSRVREEKDRTRYHQILIAKTDTGLSNLTRLASWAATKGHYYKPLVDFEQLRTYSEGLIATSSCMQGMISQAILHDGMAEAEKRLRWFLDVFSERFYFEVHDHGMEAEAKIRDAVELLSKKYDIPVICANDVHYLERNDREVQKRLMAIQIGTEKAEEYSHTGLHMATPDEMVDLFHDQFPNAVDNTMRLAESVNVQMPFGRDLVLPEYPVPEGFSSEKEYLRHACYDKIPWRYDDWDESPERTQEIHDRIDHELRIIDSMGFNRYFLIVQQITDAARDMDCLVGPGRGSAAGSIVSYLLGITNVDPLKYNLLFERFLNPERVSMPDIDIDFDYARRQDVIKWIVDNYGEESVMQICTYLTLGTKSSIRDMSRTLGISIADTDRLADVVPDGPDNSENVEVFLESAEVRSAAEDDARVRKLMNLVPRVRGMARGTSVHAAGVVITPGPVADFVPTRLAKESKDSSGKSRKVQVTQYDGGYLESLGLLKMDILGLKTLTVMDVCLRMISENHNVDIDIEEIPLEDEKTLDLFRTGDTECLFQFESGGMQQWLVQLQPDSIHDLIAMNALYRPGPMDHIPTYIARKHGEEEVAYPHPILEDVLRTTYGIPVYQEQVMQMAQVMGGFSLGKADILRRGMGKKKEKVVKSMKKEFIAGARKKGVDDQTIESAWEMMAKFAGYGFNLSHAAAYSIIAYQTAFLKAHFPAEFMAANLEVYASDKDKRPAYLQATREMGIEVRPPEIGTSGHSFTAEYRDGDGELVRPWEGDGVIYYGLDTIKYMSEDAVSAILRERKKRPYDSLMDFLERHVAYPENQLTKRHVEALVKVGALDRFGDRQQVLEKYLHHKDWLDKLRAHNTGRRVSRPEMETYKEDPDLTSTVEQRLHWEAEYLGAFLSGHPFEGLESVIQFVEMLFGARPDGEVYLNVGGREPINAYLGYIKGVTPKETKSGNSAGKPRADFSLLVAGDEAGDPEVVRLNSWWRQYAQYKGHLHEGNKVLVLAKQWSPEPGVTFHPIEAVLPVREIVADWVTTLSLSPRPGKLEDVLREIESWPSGGTKVVVQSSGGKWAGPSVSLSPMRVRRISKLASTRLF